MNRLRSLNISTAIIQLVIRSPRIDTIIIITICVVSDAVFL